MRKASWKRSRCGAMPSRWRLVPLMSRSLFNSERRFTLRCTVKLRKKKIRRWLWHIIQAFSLPTIDSIEGSTSHCYHWPRCYSSHCFIGQVYRLKRKMRLETIDEIMHRQLSILLKLLKKHLRIHNQKSFCFDNLTSLIRFDAICERRIMKNPRKPFTFDQ